MMHHVIKNLLRIATLTLTFLFASQNIVYASMPLTVTDGTSTDPYLHKAYLTLYNTATTDVLCNMKITGIIRGRDQNGAILVARQSSDAVVDFLLRGGRSQERTFDFANSVTRMRLQWRDPNAILSEVDSSSLDGDCRSPSMGPTVLCEWQGAKVNVGEWLECPSCLYRYCQCQPNSKWGNCGSSQPSDGSCNWSNPDWSDPACSQGGSMACDWNNPDWANPACSGK